MMNRTFERLLDVAYDAAAGCSSSAATRCSCSSPATTTRRAPATPPTGCGRRCVRSATADLGRAGDAEDARRASTAATLRLLPRRRVAPGAAADRARRERARSRWRRRRGRRDPRQRRTRRPRCPTGSRRREGGGRLLLRRRRAAAGIAAARRRRGSTSPRASRPDPPVSRTAAPSPSTGRPRSPSCTSAASTSCSRGRRRTAPPRARRARHAARSAVADEHGVTFLETDIDADGGKMILVAGVPETAGEDEERMLRTARRIVDRTTATPAPDRLARGRVFAGEVGAATGAPTRSSARRQRSPRG